MLLLQHKPEMPQNDPIPSIPSIPPHLSQYIQAQIAHQSSNWSFTQGLLLGQLSMILLFIAAVRYLLLEDVDAKKKVPTLFFSLSVTTFIS